MDLVILLAAMVVIGLVMGAVAGLIWKDNRPIGVRGDYIVSVITTILVGLFWWYFIPSLITISDTLKWLGVALDPPGLALVVLWVIRRVKR